MKLQILWNLLCLMFTQNKQTVILDRTSSFAKRWSVLRTTQKHSVKNNNEFEIKDQYTLVIHYKKIHKETISDKIENAY